MLPNNTAPTQNNRDSLMPQLEAVNIHVILSRATIGSRESYGPSHSSKVSEKDP